MFFLIVIVLLLQVINKIGKRVKVLTNNLDAERQKTRRGFDIAELVFRRFISFRYSILYIISLFGLLMFALCRQIHSEKEDPLEARNSYQERINQNPVLLSLFIRDNEKCNISHAP